MQPDSKLREIREQNRRSTRNAHIFNSILHGLPESLNLTVFSGLYECVQCSIVSFSLIPPENSNPGTLFCYQSGFEKVGEQLRAHYEAPKPRSPWSYRVFCRNRRTIWTYHQEKL
jgi:hypothetical protein